VQQIRSAGNEMDIVFRWHGLLIAIVCFK